jgi:hypothetical protein
MSSAKDAFAKLDDWRRSNAVLKFIKLEDQQAPETKTIRIMAIDEAEGLVAWIEDGTRDVQPRLDLSGASFDLGKRTLEARRSETDVLMFEEM